MILNALLVLCAGHSSTIFVDASATAPGDGTQNSPYTRVDFAVTMSPTGSFIEVASGTYPDESISSDGKTLTISGVAGSPLPVLLGNGSDGIAFASAGSSLSVEFLRFEGGRGYWDAATNQTYGGAVYGARADVRVAMCEFDDCNAGFGGAVALRGTGSNATLNVVDCEIAATCFAENSGGGVYALGGRGLTVAICDITATAVYGDGGCIVSDADGRAGHTTRILSSTLVGTAYEEGGAIATFGSDTTIDTCTITGSSREDYSGGGLYFDGPSLEVASTTFEGCSAIRGGAAYVTGGGSGLGSPRFASCTFRNNRTDSFVIMGSGFGGAVAAAAPTNFVDCVFLNNTATHHPSARGGAVSGNGVLSGCTLRGNIASSGGGSIAPTSAMPIIGCIVMDGGLGGVPAIGPLALPRYCLLDEFYAGALGTVAGDPAFWGEDDVNLLPDSAAINAGDPFAPLDFDGTRADAGARTFNPAWCGDGCDGALGQMACVGAPNSTGIASRTTGIGSTVIGRDRIVLNVDRLPVNVLGYFVGSQTADFVPGAGGSAGNLCVGGSPLRFNETVLRSTPITRTVSYRLRPAALPGGGSILAGETWFFQLWHRDQNAGGGATSNFSPSLRVSF